MEAIISFLFINIKKILNLTKEEVPHSVTCITEKIKNSKQVRMIFSDTNSEPELKESDIESTIIEDLKKKMGK